MRICFIVGSFPDMKCGVGDYTYKLSEELSKQGFEIHIITSKKANCKSNLMKIHNIIEEWDSKGSKQIVERLQEIQPDIVNIQYPSNEYKNNFAMNILPLKIKKKIDTKIIATIHEYECFTLKRKIRYMLNFKKLDQIIVAEEEFISAIKKDFKNTKVKYIKISSNIPRSKLGQEEKEKLIEKYNLKDKKIISYFGFALPSKGIEYLLNLIPKLENSKLLFINELNENNEYHKTLLDLIDKLQIKDKVAITGLLDDEADVADLLSLSDVCVLPFVNGVKTRNGSFLAAYNQKIKVVTTSNNLKDKDGIYYVEPKNEEGLLEKVKIVLESKDKFDRNELTWENVAKNYIESFEEVTKR